MSLRERKLAQTRIAIMEAVVAMLAERSLADITVREISEAVNISEMTFFNYFPSKTDVIVYFVQVWSVRMQWEMAQVLERTGSYLEAVETLFTTTAVLIQETPGVMDEIVAFQALNHEPRTFNPMSTAEYDQLFPDHPGVEQIEGQGIEIIFQKALEGAVESGELPVQTDIHLVILMLANIFFGTPMLTRRMQLDPVYIYRQQLAMVWRGVRASSI